MSLLVKGGGITKLSELIIDADKVWAGMGISNIKELALAMAHGDVNFRGAAVIEKLTAGIAGQYQKTQGVGFPPIWADMPGGRFERLFFLTIPQPPSILPPDVVEDHHGGGFTESPNLVIPAPALSKEIALFDQRYDLGDDSDQAIYGVNWEAETFTTLNAHNIEIIEILCRRVLLPGDITISIRATLADVPVLPDLTSVTFSGNTLSTPANAWIARYVASVALLAATKYAIVISAPAGDIANYLIWRADATAPAYAGGARCFSGGSGADGTWTEDVNADYLFREGEVL